MQERASRAAGAYDRPLIGFSPWFFGRYSVSIILQTPLTGPAAWRGEDLAGEVIPP